MFQKPYYQMHGLHLYAIYMFDNSLDCVVTQGQIYVATVYPALQLSICNFLASAPQYFYLVFRNLP